MTFQAFGNKPKEIDGRTARVYNYPVQPSTYLAGSVAVGGTAVAVPYLPREMHNSYGWMVMGVGGTACEVRKIVGYSGGSVSWAGTLDYAHAAGDPVLFLDKPEANFTWWGVSTAAADTDNLAYAKAAVAECATAGIGSIYWPPGTYNIDCDDPGFASGNYIDITSGMRVTLDQQTTLQLSVEDDDHILFRMASASNIILEGGKIIGDRTVTGSNQNGIGIYINTCTDVIVQDMTIEDMHTDGAGIFGSGTSERVTFKNLYITNCKRNGISIAAPVADIHFNKCTFDGMNGQSPQSGVDVEPDSGESEADITFTDCIFRDNSGQGAYIQQGVGTATVRVTVNGGVASGNGSYGYNISAADHVTVNGAVAYDNTLMGIAATLCQDVTISGCEAYGNAGDGIYVEGATSLTITGNTSNGNSDSGISIKASGNTVPEQIVVTGNLVHENTDYGISLLKLSGAVVSGNVCTLNGKDGISGQYLEGVNIVGNTCTANSQGAFGFSGIVLSVWGYRNSIIGNTCRIATRYHDGTAQAGSTSSITLAADAAPLDDWYNGFTLETTGGTGSGQTVTITDYVGSTLVASATFSPAPDGTTTYVTYQQAPTTSNQTQGIYVSGSDVHETLVSNNDCYVGGISYGVRNTGTNTEFGAGNRNIDGSYSGTPS